MITQQTLYTYKKEVTDLCPTLLEALTLWVYISYFLMGSRHLWMTLQGLHNAEFGGLKGRGCGQTVVFLCNASSFFFAYNSTQFWSGIKQAAELLVKKGPSLILRDDSELALYSHGDPKSFAND